MTPEDQRDTPDHVASHSGHKAGGQEGKGWGDNSESSQVTVWV